MDPSTASIPFNHQTNGKSFIQPNAPVMMHSASYGTGTSVAVPKSEIPIKTVSHFIEKQKEVIREIPTTQVLDVEHIVEVPGEIVEVPKRILVDTHVVVPRYVDEVVPTVIAQRLEPIIREATEEDGVFVDVKCRVVTFKPVQVDVFVPLPVNRALVAKAKYEQHRELNPAVVPAEQYNALVKSLNADSALEHILPLFQVTPDVAGKIARRDYTGISAVGAIPCASGPGAAFVEVPDGTPIFPSGQMGYDHPYKVFPGLWPAADGWKKAEELNKQKQVTKKHNDLKGHKQHRYKPYNYKFSGNQFFDPPLAGPFHVHHHIGTEIQK
eukprot:GHVH01008759.1.p1 GENE.GHVH01008759.1~~GHVH01008759.1.p1  ORF type:complete len:326 (+),score=48.30 GHVH01008759.1:135-1112(+)